MRAGIFTIAVLASTLLTTAATAGTESQWTTTPTLWDSGPYHYDDAGNIAGIDDDIYRYDHVGRLKLATAVTTVPNQQSFTYDRYGNLTSVTTTSAQTTSVHGFAVSGATNQLGMTCSGAVDGCFTGVYDPATGHQLGRLGSGEYKWDALGMMTELNTGRRERYVYDANDERILVVDDVTGDERYTLRNPANKVARELSRTRANNTWKLDKDYVYRDTTLMASFSGTQTTPDRHYHVDHLGSTRLVTDASGYRLAIHTYWPFGPEAAGSETDTERLKFTGHERDSSPATSPDADLDYMHARYYDANAGRFLSVDPGKDWSLTAPQSWNLYTYVRNNPLNATDPTGRQVVSQGPVLTVKQFHFSMSLGFAWNIDLTGNVSLTATVGTGLTTTRSGFGVQSAMTYTDVDTVEQLEGTSVVAGVALGPAGVDVGIDPATRKVQSATLSVDPVGFVTGSKGVEGQAGVQQTYELVNARKAGTALGRMIGGAIARINEKRDADEEEKMKKKKVPATAGEKTNK
jgi:RHS repeat-associated protein